MVLKKLMSKKIFYILFPIFIYSCIAPTKIKISEPFFSEDKKEISDSLNWVESTLSKMTLEEKISQMLFIWVTSPYLPADATDWMKAEKLVRENKIGGFIFSTGDVYEYAIHINKLQKISKTPLLISGDYEWGLTMRIKGPTAFPKTMALGATRDTNLASQMGRAIAREARAIGIHQNYAPVVDVNNNPLNPVINTRSFGEDKNLVADLSIAMMRGMQSGGLISTAKHFPGHGDTDLDSHLDLPLIKFSKERFDSLELYPFKKIIDAGVQSVMVAHISTPELDGEIDMPGTVSKKIVTNILQDELGFKGLIVTDAMDMKGLTKKFDNGEASVRAVLAGNDILLMVPDVERTIESISDAVAENRISIERINHSVRKILEFKELIGLDKNRFVDVDKINSEVGIYEHIELSKEISRKGIVVLGNENNLLPLEHNKYKKVVDLIIADEISSTIGLPFHNEIKSRVKNSQIIRIHPESNRLDFENAIEKINSADLVLVQLHFYTRSAAMTGFLQKENIEFLQKVFSTKNPIAVVNFGNPYLAMNFQKLENYICTFSSNDFSQKSAATIIFGEDSPTGKLPITIPPHYKFGDGITYNRQSIKIGEPCEVGGNKEEFKKVDELISNAIRDSIFPGATVLAVKNGVIVHNRGYGNLTFEKNSAAVTPKTIYDLASLTKVIATTSAVMKLVDENKISLSDKVSKYIPQFSANGKDEISIYNLMVHNSGLPGWITFYKYFTTPEQVLDSIYNTNLIFKTGDSTVYSDLGLITVGKIVEKVSKTSLDKYLDSVFFKPLGMNSTIFNPSVELHTRIAPTEIDTHWLKTGKAILGRVHDENAFTLGGVSGHAGLFSTSEDLVKILFMLINDGKYNKKKYLSEKIISDFTNRQSEKSTRAIGWDTKNPKKSLAGKLFSNESFTHTGFTGTMVTVDPANKTILIFLTNRVYPTRTNTKISEIRPKLHDLIFEALNN